jgi:undecaprenyl-diphosphatase
MEIYKAVVFGIVEGITEFLPISSTAHLDFTRIFLGMENTEFLKSFQVAIQFGAILAVVVLYFKKILSSFSYVRNVMIAFLPTALIGFLLYKIIKSVLIGNTVLAGIMLVLGGLILLFIENRKSKVETLEKLNNIENLSIRQLLILGTAQALAVIPGVSRSGAVIVAGRLMKVHPSTIAEFSFLLAIPTMMSATAYDLLISGFSFSVDNWSFLAVGFIVSFFVAMAVVRMLIEYIKNHSFAIFGWYRIFAGIAVLLYIMVF